MMNVGGIDLDKIKNKDIINLIEKHTYKMHEPHENAFNIWLDYMVEYFDISAYMHGNKGYVEHLMRMKDKSYELCCATIAWMYVCGKEIEVNGWSDTLGTIYEEMYQSKGKASILGQFFTPKSITDLMAEITIPPDSDNQVKEIVDCACGSGRTLLAAFYQNKGRGRYIGQDIDYSSVKMCALNMMIHNMEGRVIQTDVLNHPVYYNTAFEINEANHPFPCGCYSLRRVSNPEPEEYRDEREDLKQKGDEFLKNKKSSTAVTPEPPKEVPKVKENNKMPEQLCLRFEE